MPVVSVGRTDIAVAVILFVDIFVDEHSEPAAGLAIRQHTVVELMEKHGFAVGSGPRQRPVFGKHVLPGGLADLHPGIKLEIRVGRSRRSGL